MTLEFFYDFVVASEQHMVEVVCYQFVECFYDSSVANHDLLSDILSILKTTLLRFMLRYVNLNFMDVIFNSHLNFIYLTYFPNNQLTKLDIGKFIE